MTNHFGSSLNQWRNRRHVSQHSLALKANSSQRHLSFIESGRAQPSRQMVLKLAVALDLPLRARNELLVAAGYAPVYPERPLDAAELSIAHHALERILAHHEPYPAMVVDGAWNILMRNSTSRRIMDACLAPAAMARLAPDGRLNFMRVMFAADGIRKAVLSWDRTGPMLMARLAREAAGQPGSASDLLMRELLANGAPPPGTPEVREELLEPVVPLELRIGEGRIRLFNTITTFGTPQDVTLQELRIETSFPADDTTDRFLRDWARAGPDATAGR